MSALQMWLWLGLMTLAFAAGFWLSWRRFKQRLQARMTRALENEVRAEVERRVLAELRNPGRARRHAAATNRGVDSSE